MVKQKIRNMKCGDLVESLWTGEVFQIIENINIKNDTVLAVNIKYLGNYSVLIKALNNLPDITDELAIKIHNYEVELKISDIKPYEP